MAPRWMDRSTPGRPAWKRLRRLIPYAAALVLLVSLRQAHLSESLNLLLYDLVTQWRAAPSGRETPIAIIGIGEADLRKLGWPLDDGLLAEAIERLDRAGVGAIGLDLYRDLGVGIHQERLRSLAASHGRLVSVYSAVDRIGAIPGTPPDRRAYIDLTIDPDGVVRRDLVHVRGLGPEGVTLPMRLLEVATGKTLLRQRIERGDSNLSGLEQSGGGYTDLDNAGVQRMLAFHRAGSFPTWSLSLLLSGGVPTAELRGKIVLIGNLAPSLRDSFRVPFSRFGAARGLATMPGVEIHAHRTAALLAQESSHSFGLLAAPGWANALLVLAGLGLGIGLGEGIGSLRRSLAAVGTLALLAALAGAVALGQGVWFDGALPLAALAAFSAAAWTRRGMEEQRQGLELERLLGQTTSAAMAHELLDKRQGLLEGGRFPGRQVCVTVLFADIAHFSRLAERLDPDALLTWLNRSMGVMVSSVHMHGGLVNKFTGDGLMAVFGAPLSQGVAEDATAAVNSASAMREQLRQLNGFLKLEGQPLLQLRVGLHSGWVIAGSVGSPERWEFGLIGDVVNCASRIESFAKTTITDHCQVMVSSTTHRLVADRVQGAWKPRGMVPLDGRSEGLEAWELIDGASPEAPDNPSQDTGSRAGS
ncbi:adenylate/guanylate cyclase domain-containing protein [Synechococcus sp. Cruz CV-v-12]|uniref:adenylate/guanylate cyclase domain-containing protein n=2 Tax=unclassified Synechococcus TaxID=2626047 RepID=UPI0020CBD912|nr:adenylate/guanylate cyclase domain-containing protein [Synechococcus sp. Cruz CV-v-12]MCP9873676.1 CHASE2 domain-containing protein [Synechococcus sp. Cruz CV-v-12]